MSKFKVLKFFVSILMIISIYNTLVITSFADSSKSLKPDTWHKLNDRPAGNEEISSKFPSVIKGIRYIGITSNDVNKVVSIHDKIYMINNDGTVLEYNTSKDIWISIDKIKDLEKSNGLFRLIAMNDKIYIIGSNLSDILEYDINKQECIFITKLPTERKVGGAIGIDNKIYILSGEEKGNPNTKKTLDEYDLTKGVWTKKKDMFGGSNDLRVTYLNGKIYTLGVGQDFEAYDINNDQWKMLSPSPSGLYGEGMEAVDGKIYILPDGYDDGNKIVKEYDPMNNTWIGKSALPYYMSTYATTLCNGEIYVIDKANIAKYTVIERKIAAENVEGSEEDNKADIEAKNDNDFSVKVYDNVIDFPDVKPFMDNNYRIQIPAKIIGDALGAAVSWNSKTKQMTFHRGDDVIVITVGKTEYTLNGCTFQTSTPAIIKDNRAYIPVNYIAEAFGADVLLDIGAKTVSISFSEKEGYTKDGLDIYHFDGKEYVSPLDIEKKYKCMIITNMFTGVITIYGEEAVAAWDLDYTKPLMETEAYATKNDSNYFEVDYFENKIKPILIKPRETIKPAYSENGLNIYLYNNKEYVLPGDVGVLLDNYMFREVSEKEFNFVKRKDEGNIFCEDYEVIVSGIPATVVNGHLSIEYEYYKKHILPKVKNK